jgi:hypothetical protein
MLIYYYTTFAETFNVDHCILEFRHIRAKVICQEGNSPDRWIRYLIIVKSKGLNIRSYLGDRLGSSHSLKKE